jgi:hypothetical protein
VEHFCFNIQWHYGLNITQESDSAKYMCTKTLWSARHLVMENRGIEVAGFFSIWLSHPVVPNDICPKIYDVLIVKAEENALGHELSSCVLGV